MATTSGAPWWLVVSLPIVVAIATHFLTLSRERSKARNEWSARWLDDAKTSVHKISNDALTHYVAADAIAKTPVSAALIVSEIRRLNQHVCETLCVNSGDAKRTADALRAFNNAITLQEDFQDPQRQCRDATSPVITAIRDAEEALLNALAVPRKRKD